MTTWVLYDDPLRSRELRHEIAEPISDAVGFIEHEGKRIVIASELERAIFEAREDLVDEFWPATDLGWSELVSDGSKPFDLVGAEMLAAALERLGVAAISVPPTMSVIVADHLRTRGFELTVDHAGWTARRRRKSPWELEGIERAQRAAETAMLIAARMLREAERTKDGRLRYEGEILTAEIIREAMSAEILGQGAESDEILVQSGDACLRGHDPGHGPILPDQTVIIDCFPRDRRSGTWSDMTRTFVPGEPSPEVQKLHAHCVAALEIALDSVAPGRDDACARVVQYFHEQGIPTQLHDAVDGRLKEGFIHALGHGVGLEVHEAPYCGQRRADPFVVGDVVAIEPGAYFEGVGGIRLEDTVIVTDDGYERFTDPFPYELAP